MGLEHIVILGMPGSGKGTQAEILAEKGYYHLSTGELFRHFLNGTADNRWYSELASLLTANDEQVRTINQGNYVNNDTTNVFIQNYFEKYTDKPTVLDGFPRTLEQAKFMDTLGLEYSVVYLDIRKSIAETRLRERDQNRADDNNEIIRKRMEKYHQETLILVPQYRFSSGLNNKKFIRVDATLPIDRIKDIIESSL